MKKKGLGILTSLALAVTTIFSGFAMPQAAANVEAAQKATPKYRNVMYYGDWSIYAGQKNFTVEKIDGSLITHLNFAFMDVDEDGNLISTDMWADWQNPNVGYSVDYESPYAGVLGAMLFLREKYPNMRIGISVGGWTRSGDFPAMAANETARKNFAKNVAKFVHYYGYDFVDIDWEYPTANRQPDPTGNGVQVDKGCLGSEADTQNFTALMQAIRDELDAYGEQDGKYYELSVAMSASPTMMAKIEYDKVLEIVDFANMMTYDLNGAWADYTAHQTALYTNDAYDPETQADGQFSVDTCIKYLEDTYGDDIDYSKVVIGVAPYTRGWAEVETNGRDPENPGLYASAAPNSVKASDGTTSGTYAYSDIDTLISQYQLTEYYDEKAQAAYYYSAETGYFFTCDNERSVAAKGNYVKEKGLGGLISWMASLDAANEITNVMKDSLYGDEAIPEQEIIIPEVGGIDVEVTASGDTYTITIKNNNALTESKAGKLSRAEEGPALPAAEAFAETIIYPTFYIKTADGDVLTGLEWEAGGVVSQKDGYTVVSVNSSEKKFTAPGASITLTLKASSGTASVSNIESISMTQRATKTSAEMGTTVLVGEGAENLPTTKPDTGDDTDKNTETDKDTEADKDTETDKDTEEDDNTQSGGNTDKEPTGTYEAWQSGVAYQLGDLVSYNGKVYECIYGHTSHGGWLPGEAPTLWQERTDLVNTPSTGGNTGGSGDSGNTGSGSDNNYYVNGTLPQHMVTGYWHNFCNGSTNLKLSDVPTYYDMICVAFTGNTSTPGEVTFALDGDLCNALGGYTKAEFIQDIKDLKAKGQHVIISVGGAEGRIEINSDAAADLFAEGLIDIIEEYGFEGVDIDLEGSAVSGVNYIADALRKVHDHFGKDFIITMAPETYYIQADRLSSNDITTAYLRLALEIKDILTICYPQFYNSGGMSGYGGTIVNPGNADFLTSLSTLIIEAGLRPDQVAIGVPSTPQAAGSGYVEPSVVETAVDALVNKTSSGNFTAPQAYPTLRGVMTWSINWDATNDYKWAKAMAAAMDELPEVANGGSSDEDNSGNTGSGNTGSGNGGSGSTDSGNGGSGSTDSGNGGNGSTDSGNGGSGSTDSGNGGSGSTDSGNGGSGSTDSGNGGSGSTDSGNGGNGSTDSGNGGSGSTDSGNGGSGSTDSGNGGSGSTDSGNGGNGSTDSGNGGSGSTDSGNTGSGSTDSGNGGSGSTDSGNTGNGSTNNGNSGSGSTDSGNTGNNGGTTGGNGTGTQETPITAIVDGTSSVNQVTQMLTANNTENDAAGSNYGKLSFRVSKSTKNSQKLKWNKVADADGYVILANTCGDKLQVVKTITNGKTTSWKHTKLKKGTYYKYVITAYKLVDGKQIAVSTSKMIHVPTTGGKYTDVKAVKVNKSKISLKKGKTAKIKAKEVKKISSKKIKRHRKLCYESSNTKIATVSKTGKIIAKSKGTCYVYVYAQNGVSKKVKVTVR